MDRNNFAVILPVFNVEDSLIPVINGIKAFTDNILVVDDGSTDTSPEKARSTGVKVISHSRNLGKGMALKTGFKNSSDFEFVITMDSDGQHNPEEIKKFLNAYFSEKCDIIIGSRLKKNRGDMPRIRWYANRWSSKLLSYFTGVEIDDWQSGYRLYRMEIFKKINLQGKGFELETEILIEAAQVGYIIKTIPIKVYYPQGTKRSHYHSVKDSWRIFKIASKKKFKGGLTT